MWNFNLAKQTLAKISLDTKIQDSPIENLVKSVYQFQQFDFDIYVAIVYFQFFKISK